MPQTLTQTISREQTPKRSNDPIRPSAPVWHRGRCVLFFLADFLFLASAGIAATVTMHWVHQLEWPLIATSVIGMIAAMLVQTLMAFAASPLLGSIESMVPSMIVAMFSPMTICLLHLFGCDSTWAMATAIATAFAIGLFIFIQVYARCCARTLMPRTQGSRG